MIVYINNRENFSKRGLGKLYKTGIEKIFQRGNGKIIQNGDKHKFFLKMYDIFLSIIYIHIKKKIVTCFPFNILIIK